MPNAKDSAISAYQRLLVVGKGGVGKTAQFTTLPGKKFLYIFDPGALPTIRGQDIEYEAFLPEAVEMDATLKGFNKNAKPDDKPKGSAREPTVYMRWVEDLNLKASSGYFEQFDWIGFDSLTLLTAAVMDRQLWINNRYGHIEDLSDYRIAGSKIAEVFRSVFSLPNNIYCTGHVNTFQDDRTKKIEALLNLPGKARLMLPLLCSNIWELRPRDEKGKYMLATKADTRGFQDIRCSIKGLDALVDITIDNFDKPGDFGIGKILTKAKVLHLIPKLPQPSAAVPNVAAAAS